jgi:hypothetical protein
LLSYEELRAKEDAEIVLFYKEKYERQHSESLRTAQVADNAGYTALANKLRTRYELGRTEVLQNLQVARKNGRVS